MTPVGENARLIVAGLGNRTHGDDGIGVYLAESIRPRLPSGVLARVWENADAFTLAQELLERDNPVLFVDCAHMGKEPGSAHWWPEGAARLNAGKGTVSTHGFGLDYAVDLARGLGFDRPLYFFGVEPARVAPGGELSCELRHVYGELERALLTTIQTLLADIDRE